MFIVYYTDYKEKFDSFLKIYSSVKNILSNGVYKDHVCDNYAFMKQENFSSSELIFYKDNNSVFWERVFY